MHKLNEYTGNVHAAVLNDVLKSDRRVEASTCVCTVVEVNDSTS